MQEISCDEDSQSKNEEDFNLCYKVEYKQSNYPTPHMILLNIVRWTWNQYDLYDRGRNACQDDLEIVCAVMTWKQYVLWWLGRREFHDDLENT